MKTSLTLKTFNKKTLIAIAICTISYASFAQKTEGPKETTKKPTEQNESGKWKNKIETAKIGFITQRLNLTSEQAQQFWPVYNDLENKKKAFKEKYEKNPPLNLTAATDDEVLNQIDKNIDYRQAELDLDKEFKAKFLKVINIRQLAELYRADREFNRMLLRRLDEKSKIN